MNEEKSVWPECSSSSSSSHYTEQTSYFLGNQQNAFDSLIQDRIQRRNFVHTVMIPIYKRQVPYEGQVPVYVMD